MPVKMMHMAVTNRLTFFYANVLKSTVVKAVLRLRIAATSI